MYSLVIVIGLLTLALGFAMLHNERVYRKRRFERKLKNACFLIYEREADKKDGQFVARNDFIPLTVAECTIGRRKKNSIADYRIKTDVASFSGNAARFFFDGENFHVQRTGQEKIWLRRGETGDVFVIFNVGANVGAEHNPFKTGEPTLVHEDEMVIHRGDQLVFGKLMLEYVEGDERVHAN